MPVRLLSSPVLKWPDAQTVDKAVRRWAEDINQNRKDVLRIGYFGSYARGDWGVGSDLDLIVIVKRSDLPFERRSVSWNVTGLPVPVDLLIYTQEEWNELHQRKFYSTVMREAIWVLDVSQIASTQLR